MVEGIGMIFNKNLKLKIGTLFLLKSGPLIIHDIMFFKSTLKKYSCDQL